ncbi:DUF4270 domain-containing protein [Flavobacterium franklandianum]|uniref:DUF4270 domain-containing protein n=1 Tax=Flavobacterium franklandianum TaxID=2594430 RepID=A0A553CST7_9FLAO|nr:DUF4270 domain-containing protein [Flavobacterium franklandianum]TRX23600.1 DUF4270 domain-containing protein [Flavobacterium franklandianum]
MHNNSLFKSLLFIAGILLFVSCDKEYSAIGDALIGDNNFELVKYPSNVVAHNEKIIPIESDNLDVNALGIYDNPAFGKTTANFVTQLALGTLNPTFGANPLIESVYIDVPYFVDATQTAAITTGGNTYVLDSIYGEKLAKIKLSVFESGLDMDSDGVAQTFYTNQNSDFDNYKIGNRLNDDSDKSQNDEFFYNPAQNSVTTKDAAEKETISYSAPGMRLKLNVAFFQNKIFNAPTGTLSVQNVFDKYFRGLYFKVEQSGADKGSLAVINFKKGTITIKYKEDSSTTPVTRVEKTLILNMSGATASLLEQSNPNTDYTSITGNPNRDLGDQKLYLKGGEGSLAVLELFEKKDLIGYDANGNLTGPNNVSDELDKMRKEGWLINDANLIFHIDAKTMKDSYEPDRIYLYDYTNNTTILDYYLGASTANKNTSKYLFGGYLTKNATLKRGVSYKMNITNHIRNLVKNSEAKNVKLGVVVTEDMNFAEFKMLKTGNAFISKAPKASVMNPLGTILYGSNFPDTDANYSKRLQLEIYYTKPK